MRHGYSVPELIMVLAVVGLLLGIAAPRLTALRDSLAVAEASQRLIGAHRRARITAILRGRAAMLSIGPDTFTIRFIGDTGDAWGAPGPAAAGVRLEGQVRRLTFSPVGITTGLSNATFRLSRGASVRSIVVSRLGRVRRGP